MHTKNIPPPINIPPGYENFENYADESTLPS